MILLSFDSLQDRIAETVMVQWCTGYTLKGIAWLCLLLVFYVNISLMSEPPKILLSVASLNKSYSAHFSFLISLLPCFVYVYISTLRWEVHVKCLLSPFILSLIFSDRASCWPSNWPILIFLDWQVMDLQGSFCVFLPSIGALGLHLCTWFFLLRC